MLSSITLLAFVATIQAHTVGWANGMYCRNGTTGVDDNNTNTAVNPLYNLTKADWWFQHDRNCDAFPPSADDFLILPASGTVTLELAHNRGQTTLSYGGKYAGEWPDGKPHPEYWNGTFQDPTPEKCIQDDGAMHVSNHSDAAGTALAISYESDITKVTLENLVVFSVLANSPWKRIATYKVPAQLPECPPGGCHCAWLWVPRGCGTQNMYMAGYKCKVTNVKGTLPVAPAKAPVFCKGDPSKCVKGAKQMIVWHQLEGNNVVVPPGQTPGYNAKCGWTAGAQNDIFVSQKRGERRRGLDAWVDE